MKKIAILAMLIFFVGAFAFAIDFTVVSVSGRVTSSGTAIAAGAVISGDAEIRAGVGASLVLRDPQGNEVTIRGNGKVSDLVSAASNSRIGGNVVTTNTESTSSSSRTTSTASARASDQAGGDEITAE